MNFTVDADISKAKTLNKQFYTEAAIFDEAKEKLFAGSWQFIGSSDLLSNGINCYPFTLLPGFLAEPLLLTKDKDGIIRCLSNVCTHRGNLLATEACATHQIKCKYHGRLFQLDGKMTSMPEFREVQDFPAESDHLHHLPTFQWGKWMFTSLNPLIEATDVFQAMQKRLSWLPVQEFVARPDLNKEYSVNAHWALYCENYLEGFHIPFVHAGLNAVIDYGAYTTELFRYSNLQVGIAKKGEASFDLPVTSPDYGKNIAAYYFWLFPNLMFNFYPWGLSINVVNPISLDKTKVHFITYMWNEELYDKGAGSDLDKVEMEDEEVVQNVQMGIRSRFYDHGRYSVTREQGTHHFHRILTEFIN